MGKSEMKSQIERTILANDLPKRQFNPKPTMLRSGGNRKVSVDRCGNGGSLRQCARPVETRAIRATGNQKKRLTRQITSGPDVLEMQWMPIRFT